MRPACCSLRSSRELQELLDWERTTTLLAMHSEEAAAAAADPTAEPDAGMQGTTTPTTSDEFVML